MRHKLPRTLVSLVLLLAACGPQDHEPEPQPIAPDSNTGGDGDIAGQLNGLYDFPVSDNVNAEQGDNTDIRYMDVTEAGTTTLRVTLVSATVVGMVSILDAYGAPLQEVPLVQGQGEVVIDSFAVRAGRYFVKVYASEGASDYTIGQTFVVAGPSEEDLAWRNQQLARARQAMVDGDYATARSTLQGILDRFPGDREIELELELVHAYELMASEDYDGARDYLESLKSRFGDDPMLSGLIDMQKDLVAAYEQTGRHRWDRGRDAIAELRNAYADNSRALAALDLEDTHVDVIEEEYTRAHPSRPHHPEPEAEPEPTPEPEPNPEVTPEPTPEPEPAPSVEARIVTVRDRGAGTGVTLVLTGCGSSSGLSEGTHGTIGRTSHRATITRITGGASCEAESSASAGEIGSASTVSFSP